MVTSKGVVAILSGRVAGISKALPGSDKGNGVIWRHRVLDGPWALDFAAFQAARLPPDDGAPQGGACLAALDFAALRAARLPPDDGAPQGGACLAALV
jgi:hypothetical protein